MSKTERHFVSLFHIGVAIHHFNKYSERYLGLSLVQWCLLKQLINMPAVSAHTLALAVGIHPSSLTQTLKRLERKKYVVIMNDPQDTRKKIISISRLGKDVLEITSKKLEVWSIGLSDIGNELGLIQTYLEAQISKGQMEFSRKPF
ncbi:MAG: MarR family transcriptional regulator [Bdellovibrionaceae bacterium]|nr:MarR family transcriptional regulator [Pseudobdellovibrionaceae bacterium]